MNILIISVGALGDVLRTTFIAQALKEKHKNSKIFWITDKKAKPLFLNNPHVDFVIPYENKEKLKQTQFDLIINLEENEESCTFVCFLI